MISKHYNHKYTKPPNLTVTAWRKEHAVRERFTETMSVCLKMSVKQILTIVSLLFIAEPVHLAITLSMHFLWIAALHSKRHKHDVVRHMGKGRRFH